MNQTDNLLERARRAYACRCNRTSGIIHRGSKFFNRIDGKDVLLDTIRGELAPHKSGPTLRPGVPLRLRGGVVLGGWFWGSGDIS